jgi:stage V sporulation protein SpoVS
MQLRASRRDLALAVAVASATVVWRTGASPVAAIGSGILSAAIAFAIHRWFHGK